MTTPNTEAGWRALGRIAFIIGGTLNSGCALGLMHHFVRIGAPWQAVCISGVAFASAALFTQWLIWSPWRLTISHSGDL